MTTRPRTVAQWRRAPALTAATLACVMSLSLTSGAAAQEHVNVPDLWFPGSSQLPIVAPFFPNDPSYATDRSPGWINIVKQDSYADAEEAETDGSFPADFDVYRVQSVLSDLIQDVIDHAGLPGREYIHRYEGEPKVEQGLNWSDAMTRIVINTPDYEPASGLVFNERITKYFRSLGVALKDTTGKWGSKLWVERSTAAILVPALGFTVTVEWRWGHKDNDIPRPINVSFTTSYGNPDYSVPIGTPPRVTLPPTWRAAG